MKRPARCGCLLLGIVLGTPSLAESCTASETLRGFTQTGIAPEGADCGTFRTASNLTGVLCQWGFGFRDAAANTFADALWDDLRTCHPGTALAADTGVNHPDSYDLRQWQTSTGTYAISVKDKGALSKTLVFLRVEPD